MIGSSNTKKNSTPEAVQREAEIKKKKSRKYIEWLISSAKRHIEITVKHKNY
jgi:hypothetical protein